MHRCNAYGFRGLDTTLETTKARPHEWDRVAWFSLVAVVFGLVAVEWFVVLANAPRAAWGVDFTQYQEHAARWLSGGSFYKPWQFEGPYPVLSINEGQPVPELANPSLYPPSILPLLVPLLYLPAVLWWAVPAGIVGYALYRHRPSPLGWLAIGLLALYPRTVEMWLYGNPGIWAMAAVAAGTLWRWPGVFVLLKPSLFPFALVGIRSRGWWVAGMVWGLVSLAFLPTWFEWVTVMRNAQSSLLYSLADVPVMAIPLVAWRP